MSTFLYPSHISKDQLDLYRLNINISWSFIFPETPGQNRRVGNPASVASLDLLRSFIVDHDKTKTKHWPC